MTEYELVLGIDGGGTSTIAWLAHRDARAEPLILGRGVAGPSNPQAIGRDAACANLDRAVEAAAQSAGVPAGPFAAAVLGLAGADRPEMYAALGQWARQRQLAECVRIVHDAVPIVAAGCDEGWGIALIAGTGSFAFGQSAEGRTARAGGWGYLLGDEGSAYAMAVAGLRAAARAADGRGPKTVILPRLLDRLNVNEPLQIIPPLYAIAGDRAAVAGLAGVVTAAADAGDAVAHGILDQAASELAAMVAAVARQLDCAPRGYDLALAGGLLLACEPLRKMVGQQLDALSWPARRLTLVPEPVIGAVKLALADAAR